MEISTASVKAGVSVSVRVVDKKTNIEYHQIYPLNLACYAGLTVLRFYSEMQPNGYGLAQGNSWSMHA